MKNDEQRLMFGGALPASLVVHLALGALVLFGLPSLHQQPEEEQAISVELVPAPEEAEAEAEAPPAGQAVASAEEEAQAEAEAAAAEEAAKILAERDEAAAQEEARQAAQEAAEAQAKAAAREAAAAEEAEAAEQAEAEAKAAAEAAAQEAAAQQAATEAAQQAAEEQAAAEKAKAQEAAQQAAAKAAQEAAAQAAAKAAQEAAAQAAQQAAEQAAETGADDVARAIEEAKAAAEAAEAQEQQAKAPEVAQDEAGGEQAAEGKDAAGSPKLGVLQPVERYGEEDAGPREAPDGDGAKEAAASAEEPGETSAGQSGVLTAAPGGAAGEAGSVALVPKPADNAEAADETPKDVTKLLSPEASGDAVATTAMGDVPRGVRAGRLCVTALRDELRRGLPPYYPDILPAYRLEEGNVLDVPKAAFRTGGRWFDLSYRCEVDGKATRVVGFSYRVGEPLPRSEWKRRGLPAR